MGESRPANAARRRWTLLVAGVVAALAVGVIIGRASAPDAPPAEPPDDEPPPTATGPGPTDVEDGVPVGYQRTQAGAVAAAAQYRQVLGSDAVLHDEDRARMLDVLAANGSRDELERGLRQVADSVREAFNLSAGEVEDRRIVTRGAPAGYQVEAYRDDAATVLVWSSGVFVVEGSQGIDAGWATSTVELIWEDDDWRVQSFSTSDGPSPAEAGPETAGEVGERIEEFEDFRYVPAE